MSTWRTGKPPPLRFAKTTEIRPESDELAVLTVLSRMPNFRHLTTEVLEDFPVDQVRVAAQHELALPW
jgi:hypothetical protein